MQNQRIFFSLTVLLALHFGLSLYSAAAAGPVYDDPAKADQSYALQGEYSGTLNVNGETQKVGVQVISLGDDQFRSVSYFGGLPGDGWDRNDPMTLDGVLENGKVEFNGDHAVGTLIDGRITVTSDGSELGTLAKVERKSETLGKPSPDGAKILFDGSTAENWNGGKMTEDNLLIQGTSSIPIFQDHTLHIEFRLPYQPSDRGQGRGNSGIYLQGRYEVQMLDSFGLKGENNECGGIYSIKKPDLNMCYPPLAWQTYDIDFTAARYDSDGKLTANPRMTVWHNGVVIHDDVELPKSTTAAPNRPGPDGGPVYLQDHGGPVRYRNIWVVEK